MTNTFQPIPYSISKDHNVWYSQQSGRGELLEGVNTFQMKYFLINFFHFKHIVNFFVKSSLNKLYWFWKKPQTNQEKQKNHCHVTVKIICKKFE